MPSCTSTRNSTGIGTASMPAKNRKPKRMLPVLSAMNPTTKGPRKDADLSVSEYKEKKDDSRPGGMSSA